MAISVSHGLDEKTTATIILSSVGWTLLYFSSKIVLPAFSFYRKFDKVRQYKTRGLVPSTAFIVFSCGLSVYTLISDSDLQQHRLNGNTELSSLIIDIATGYFIYDSVVIALHLKDDGVAYLAHGILCLFTYGLAAFYHVYHFYGPVFLLFEFTTLFVNCRWILYELNLKDSKMYFWNGLCLLIAWFLVRIVFGFSSSYFFWTDTVEAYRRSTVAVPIMGWYCFSNISLNCLNVMWFLQIVRGALKAVSGGKGSQKDDERGATLLRQCAPSNDGSPAVTKCFIRGDQQQGKDGAFNCSVLWVSPPA
eukprot:CAMPEP_0196735734 /NCGR_PEP_ID=MMETSP1091-20130531/14055_1 /TAXON_ID=302021 /ORGANISM="Rhodomonas sp., Strain CCMP768" /LENGTH=305 /DNA_ID=CAMNT_0042079395 /DNA_START=49 /DNA_END=967 /DNA_ORIENTATION=-